MRYLGYSIILILLAVPLMASANETEVYEAGSRDLQFFLNSIPEGHEGLYGFTSRDVFEKAELGRPIPMRTIDQNADYSLVEVNEWRLPVIIHGKAVVFLTVSLVNGQWQAVEIGASRLAKEISQVHDVEAIVRLYSLKYDFIMLGQDKFIPLNPASTQHNFTTSSGSEYYTYIDLVELLKEVE